MTVAVDFCSDGLHAVHTMHAATRQAVCGRLAAHLPTDQEVQARADAVVTVYKTRLRGSSEADLSAALTCALAGLEDVQGLTRGRSQDALLLRRVQALHDRVRPRGMLCDTRRPATLEQAVLFLLHHKAVLLQVADATEAELQARFLREKDAGAAASGDKENESPQSCLRPGQEDAAAAPAASSNDKLARAMDGLCAATRCVAVMTMQLKRSDPIERVQQAVDAVEAHAHLLQAQRVILARLGAAGRLAAQVDAMEDTTRALLGNLRDLHRMAVARAKARV